MIQSDVERVWRVLRAIGTTPSEYTKTYPNLCRAILVTSPLCSVWEEGLTAITEGGLVQWGKKYGCFYDLDGEWGWMWAIRWMSYDTMNAYIKEYC